MKYTNEDLKQMQSFDLNRKIQITQTRIIEFYEKLEGKVYISFSGGKDSTVLLDLVRRIYPDVPAVYIDTGLEYPEIKQFVKMFDNVTALKPEMSFRQVIEKYGYPVVSKEVSQGIYEWRNNPTGCWNKKFDPDSEYNKKYKNKFSLVRWTNLRDSDIPISHMCCNVMKKKPAKKYEKETGLHPIISSMACESQLRATRWREYGCNAFDGKRITSQPMSIWTEQDVLEYLKRFDIPYCPVYGNIEQDKNGKYFTTGCQRTGCVFCGFGAHREKEPNRFQKLKQTHPQLWEYCMRPWDEGGLGMKYVLDYLEVKIE